MYFLCLLDMERFHRFVMSDNFKATYDLEDSLYAVLEKEDISLMQFGTRLMKQVFFGLRTIPEKNGVWERRVDERQEVWEARRQAEIQRQQQAEDQRYSSDSD